jgi:hypothetical protein
MDRGFYLHVTSKDSFVYFPTNEANSFRLKLNTPLNLTGLWKIGLCQLMLNGILSENVCIVCNICQGFICDGTQTRILRILRVDKNENFDESYPVIFYVPVEVRFIDTIEFRLIERDGSPVLFKPGEGSVNMTLHLKRF